MSKSRLQRPKIQPLKAKLARERRLAGRVRQEITFGPLTQADLIVFYKGALGLDLSPDLAAMLTRHSGGNFRAVVNGALEASRRMKVSGVNQITKDIVRGVIGDESGR